MEETVTISKERYEQLCRLAIYVQDWCPNYIECEHCGSYHPKGYICLDCRERKRK